ncbi:MAG: hypothetical protein HQL34_02375 [Alphaproteobacteria bacterium]|nr:hypothetical protein [Alphaproteobacteria bacterium]
MKQKKPPVTRTKIVDPDTGDVSTLISVAPTSPAPEAREAIKSIIMAASPSDQIACLRAKTAEFPSDFPEIGDIGVYLEKAESSVKQNVPHDLGAVLWIAKAKTLIEQANRRIEGRHKRTSGARGGTVGARSRRDISKEKREWVIKEAQKLQNQLKSNRDLVSIILSKTASW